MATRGVKITGLNELGSNLSANTILVTVDPNLDLTLQANVQSLGNFILENAGNIFPESKLANTVSNPAQPNITSVGTLIDLSVAGNTSVGNNLSISNNLSMGGNANITGNLIVNNILSNDITADVITANTIIANIVTAEIANGTSNVDIPIANGPVRISVSGNANIATFTGEGMAINGISDLGNVGNVKIYGGANRSILQTDGLGNLMWGPDLLPAGPNMAIQFNDDGNLGGSGNLIYNKNTDTLTGFNIDVGNALGFTGPGAGKISFIAPNTANYVGFIVPDSNGTEQQVLGIVDQASQKMGWKTVPVYYITVDLRDGSNYLSSPDPVLRVYPVGQRDGSYLDLNVTQI